MTATITPAVTKNGHVIDHDSRKRRSQLRWIRIGSLKTAAHAQRPFLPHWANELLASFDLENMGHLVVSHRGGFYYVIDGQHRLWVLRELSFSDEDTVPCEVYEGLSEKQESQLFIDRNHAKTIAALSRFRVAVNAGLHNEVEIDGCVRAQGLRIGNSADGAIPAVAALAGVHRRSGTLGLGETLRIIRDAYGTAGFKAIVIEGIGLLVQRYEDALVEDHAVKALAAAAGGLNGLLTQAEKTRASMGQSKGMCVAATAVTFYNRLPGGKKLAPWWKE